MGILHRINRVDSIGEVGSMGTTFWKVGNYWINPATISYVVQSTSDVVQVALVPGTDVAFDLTFVGDDADILLDYLGCHTEE